MIISALPDWAAIIIALVGAAGALIVAVSHTGWLDGEWGKKHTRSETAQAIGEVMLACGLASGFWLLGKGSLAGGLARYVFFVFTGVLLALLIVSILLMFAGPWIVEAFRSKFR